MFNLIFFNDYCSLKNMHSLGLFTAPGMVRGRGCGNVHFATRPEIDAKIAYGTVRGYRLPQY